MKGHVERIERHYAACWAAPVAARRWRAGPIEEVSPEFRVLVVPRAADTAALVTAGMSAPGDASPLELHLLDKTDRLDADLRPVTELLAAVAHFHRTARALDVGHTVDFGRPWVEGSGCPHGLVSLPYLDGPALEWMEEPRVRFLWLIPITAAEREYKMARGLEALERKFEGGRVDLSDPLRRSAV